MRIIKERPPMPPPEYVLRMSYPDLHNLYHDLHDLVQRSGMNGFEHIIDLYMLVKEHA